MQKLTYEDWFNGDVTLKYAKSVSVDGSEPKLVSWDEFKEDDIIKIKEEQEKLFHEIVESRIIKFKDHFQKIYERSKVKDELIESEKKEIISILSSPIQRQKKQNPLYPMFSELPYEEEIISKKWRVKFDINDLLEIQAYFKNTIIGGEGDGYDFVQSPNDKHQYFWKILPQAYAMILFEYLEWLDENFNGSEDTSKMIKDKTKYIWFKVGFLFANGEMDSLIKKHSINNNPNFNAISKELKNESFRPYIYESFYARHENNKNIFSSKSKVSYIEGYCKKNNIPIVESFKERVKKYN